MVRITVFGPLRVQAEGKDSPTLERPVRAVLAWLALHPGPHRRTDVVKATGLSSDNLRPALSRLRSHWLRELDVLRVGHDDVELARGPGVEVDYDTVLEARRPDAPFDARDRAFYLVTGDAPLLEDVAREAATEWVADARTEAEELAVELAQRNADELESTGDVAGAAGWTRAWVELEPLSEAAASRLVIRLTGSGRTPEAVAAAEAFVARLDAEGLEPSPAFVRRLRELRSGDATLEREAPVVAEVPLHTRVPLVGRDGALAELRVQVDAASTSRRVVLLTGESGAGKTRLCAALAEDLRAKGRTGTAVLYGRFALEPGREYAAYADALEAFLLRWDRATLSAYLGEHGAELGRLIPALRERLPNLPVPPPADKGIVLRNRFDAVSRTLSRIAEAGPAVFILDDLHWADESSLELLARVIAYTDDCRLTFVCAGRPALGSAAARTLAALREDYPGAIAELPLERLGPVHTSALATSMLGRELSEAEADRVKAESDGNPGRVERACTELPRAASAPPAQLSDEDRRVLQVAALLDTRVDPDVVAAAGGLPVERVREALSRAAAQGVLAAGEPDGGYAFPHELFRDEYRAADVVPAAEWPAVSRRAAEFLERRDEELLPARQARLWRQAGVPERAVGYLQEAARAAAKGVAHEQAAELLGEALELLTDIPAHEAERCAVLLDRGDALWNAGRFRAATEVFSDAAGIARAPEHLARAALGYAGRLGFQGVTTDTSLTDLLERALAAQPDGDSITRARLTASLAQALTFLGPEHNRRGVELSRDAEAMARRLALADPNCREVLVDVVCRTSWATWTPANIADRRGLAKEMVELAQTLNMPDRELESRVFRMCGHLESGQIDDARLDWTRCAELAGALRLPYYSALVTFSEAMFELLDGSERGDALCRQALERGSRQEHQGVMQLFGAQILYVYLLRGRAEELVPASRDLTEYYEGFAAWRAGLALIYTESGALELAAEQINRLLELGVPEDMFWLICMDHLARCLATIAPEPERDTARKREVYEALKPFEERYVVAGGAIAIHGSVAYPLGRLATALGELEEAQGHLDRAFRLARRIGCVPAQAEAQLEHALVRLVLEPGDVAYALGLLRSAVESVKRCGAVRLAERAVDAAVAVESQAIATGHDAHGAEAAALADEAKKVVEAAVRPVPATRRRRSARFLSRAAAGVSRRLLDWSDEKLDRQLMNPRTQAAMFHAMAALYQADRGLGFSGEVAFRLTSDFNGARADWTIAIDAGEAQARRGWPAEPAVAVTISCRNFVRLLARDLNGVEGWVTGELQVGGDPIVAARLVEMFGGEDALMGPLAA